MEPIGGQTASANLIVDLIRLIDSEVFLILDLSN